MNRRVPLLFYLLVAALSVGVLTTSPSFAATIPAGTTLVVRTLHSVSTADAPGKAVAMQLDKDVVVNGKVALPTGTKISGRVETSKRTRTPTRSQDLTVNITDAQVHGRTVAIKTTGAVSLENAFVRTTPRGVQVSTFNYQVPLGTKVQFRLAQPLQL
jgi:hypothetical protein